MTHRIPILLAAALLCAGATTARAESRARTATIELVDTKGGTSKTVAFTLSLVDDGATSVLDARTSDGAYQLKVRRDAGRVAGAEAMLSVELSRHDDGPRSLSMHATTTAAVGKRAVLLRLDRGDGSKYEVAATVR